MILEKKGCFEIIEKSINEKNNILTIKELCEIAGVSRSGYYKWINSKEIREKQEQEDRKDFDQILQAYKFRGYDKGVRGIHMRLLHMGERMNLKKIRRLMRKYGLTCPIRKANPYRRMAKAIKTNNVADNLVNREFKAFGARTVLLTDITYIPYNKTHCYLSTIIDAFTKQVLSYVLSETLELDFVLESICLLIENHGISMNSNTIIHSDQGAHYTSLKFIHLVKNSKLRQSMSRKGNCWDNAPQESFFGHMKEELADKIKALDNFKDIKNEIDNWIDYYNNDRYQWNLSKLSPNQYFDYITFNKYPINFSSLSNPSGSN